MSEEIRDTERLNSEGKFERIFFKELHKGDTFRMFEKSGDLVTDMSGESIFRAWSNSFINNDGHWEIEIE